ncbi:poly-gamma-glutamate hydrolase family protein [Streptomyces sp. NPDC101132]|uniref:poly-gamma-glutamate hydrolase family protein n=1 Tax=Streptomyces sp. NPDC101132 TaxID=3366110 RepID=UPI003811BBFD
MADLYDDYADLAANEVEGVDYSRHSNTPAGATWSSIAIHGGGIEAGSGEMAYQVAGSRMMYYEFKGLKNTGNQDLHITSTHFDEPICVALQATALRTISFHGYTGTLLQPETALGGLDPLLRARIATALRNAGFAVINAPSEIGGTDPLNIANRNVRGEGVQLEMSRAQRQQFFPNGDTSRAMRDSGQRTAAFYAYAAAVQAAYEGYGYVSLTSINTSRYCTISAPSADVDISATVSTDKLASGGGHFMQLVARWADASNTYLARLEFSTTQTVILTLRKRVAGTETLLVQHTTDLTHAAGRRFAIRLQVSGSTLRAKAWLDGTYEPPAWQLETTDTSLTAAGSVGVRSILSSTNTNVLPVTASWGDFRLRSDRQRVFVTRSANGVSKSHSALADVRLRKRPVVAL